MTALILAVENGHFECARMLLENGADKDAACHVRASLAIHMKSYFEVFFKVELLPRVCVFFFLQTPISSFQCFQLKYAHISETDCCCVNAARKHGVDSRR
jgi:hypothetical protein